MGLEVGCRDPFLAEEGAFLRRVSIRLTSITRSNRAVTVFQCEFSKVFLMTWIIPNPLDNLKCSGTCLLTEIPGRDDPSRKLRTTRMTLNQEDSSC